MTGGVPTQRPSDDELNDVIDELGDLLGMNVAMIQHFTAVIAPSYRGVLRDFAAAVRGLVLEEAAQAIEADLEVRRRTAWQSDAAAIYGMNCAASVVRGLGVTE